MRSAVSVAILSLVLLGGCKGNRLECDKAARNYATVVYWERTNAEIAKLPKEQQDAARKDHVAKFTKDLETQIDFFVNQCVNANNDDQVACMIKAKTTAEMRECADLIKPD